MSHIDQSTARRISELVDDTPALLPCPFCEGPPKPFAGRGLPPFGAFRAEELKAPDGLYVKAHVYCHECGAAAEEFTGPCLGQDDVDGLLGQACAAWNRRDNRHRNLYDSTVADGLIRPLHASARPAEAVAYGIIDPDYARIFTMARVLAWDEGYALAMHGSFTRDLDLIAVPWVDRACEPEHLVRRIADATDLRIQHGSPGDKPHGRNAWTLLLPGFADPRWVDLSVMPRAQAAAQPAEVAA